MPGTVQVNSCDFKFEFLGFNDLKNIGKGDGIEACLDIVKTITPLAQHTKAKIHFGIWKLYQGFGGKQKMI